MSSKKLKINIAGKSVQGLMDAQNYIVKNGKESYVSEFEDMMERIAESSESIEDYIDDLLPDSLYCELVTLGSSEIDAFKEKNKKYSNIDMLNTSVDISTTEGGICIGVLYFGIDRSVKGEGTSIISILNIDFSNEDILKDEIDDLTANYNDKENGILSLLHINDFVSYMVANNFAGSNYGDYIYIKGLCEVCLPASFEITYENVDDVANKAKKMMELFSNRVSETTPYSVSSIKSDNDKLYINFHESNSDEVKFVFQIDLHNGESTININKTGNMSKSKMEKAVRRFRKYRDIAFLIDHVYYMFSVMAYCNSLKKTVDTYVN